MPDGTQTRAERIEADIEKMDSVYKARRARKREELKRARRREAERERKARTHALATIGGLVVQHMPDGDWRQVDFDALAAYLSRYAGQIAKCRAEALPTAEATARLKEWEDGRKPGRSDDGGAQDEVQRRGQVVQGDGRDVRGAGTAAGGDRRSGA